MYICIHLDLPDGYPVFVFVHFAKYISGITKILGRDVYVTPSQNKSSKERCLPCLTSLCCANKQEKKEKMYVQIVFTAEENKDTMIL